MAEKQEQQAVEKLENDSKPSFVEVVCKSSGKVRRFAPGTDAAFAVSLINKKLLLQNVSRTQLVSHIEAVKPGSESEEPISFGPTAPLVNFGSPWILQTVVAQSHSAKRAVKGSEGSRSARKESKLPCLLYIAKIVLALLFVFSIGAVFMLFLENLPALLLYIHYDM